jgi:hypothetical protein
MIPEPLHWFHGSEWGTPPENFGGRARMPMKWSG